MAKLSSYEDLTLAPSDLDEITGVFGGQTKNVPVGLLVKTPGIIVGPAGTASHYTTLAAAIAALPATGGRIFLRNGTYSMPTRAQNTANVQGIVIEGESQAGVVLQASQSIYSASPDQHYGLVTVRSHTSAINSIVIRNLTVDGNRQKNTTLLSITGGTSSAGTNNILIERVTFKNMGTDSTDTSRGVITFFSGTSSQGTFGLIDDVTIRDCTFDYSEYYHIYALGTGMTNVKIYRNTFKNNQSNTIHMAAGAFRSFRHWTIEKNRFVDTKQRYISGTVGDIFDGGETGVYDIKIKDNYFTPHYNVLNIDETNVKLYASWGVEIAGNFFNGGNQAMSIGKSFAGNYYKIEPDNMISIHDNIFFRITGSVLDPDSNIFCKFTNNYFAYCAEHGYGGYSRHWPTVLDGNEFYNCGQHEETSPAYHQAAVETNGDGLIVRNCRFIDDQQLNNPTTAPTLSQAAGGSLGARTYFVKYTWSNNTGETLGSSAASLSLSANNLLTFTMPTTAPYPTGATQIKIYAGTSSGNETYQDKIDIAYNTDLGEINWFDLSWTEPTTGLVAGAALPSSNTTHHTMLYGIYEAAGGISTGLTNEYYNNHFYGLETPMLYDSSIKRIARDNFANDTITTGGEVRLESVPYEMGNVTGAVSFNVGNGECLKATLTGNVTTTLSNGHYVGQRLRLLITQDGTGSRTLSKPSNANLAQAAFSPTSTPGATDQWILEWDGTDWNEITRSLNQS